MKKSIIYTNRDNQDFTIEPYVPKTYIEAEEEKNMVLTLSNGTSQLYFLSKDEVDEFCKILQEVKKEVWHETN